MRKSLPAWPCVAFILGLIFVTNPAPAQTGDVIPSVGTFYLQSAGLVSVPYPFDPYQGNEPIEVLNSSNRVYLIQDSADDFAALQSVHGLARRSMVMDDLGDDGGDGSSSDSFSYVVPTNGLYLQICSVSNGLAHLDLMNATNSVYAVQSTESVSGGWQVVAEVWPTNGAVMPFTVPTLGQPTLFLRAADWTGVTSGGNTVPEWWFYKYFGTVALSDTNLDASGVNTLLSDYQSGGDPNVIQFSLEVANNYVNTSYPTLAANIIAGTPFYYAVVVDSTNLAGATWTAYTTSNLTASLGSLQGWHEIWVGLRGKPADATPTWQRKRLKLDTSPPLLVVTNPTTSTVSVPLIQLQGYSPEALSGISYDLTNAVGLVTNQQVLITGQFCSTNTWEFTTNFFECVDVPLTNGVNTFTLHATDLAGNTTTTNFSVTLDYSGKTNPPVMQLDWPQDGMVFCGSQIVCRGWVSDPTATIIATMVDANSTTNTFNGRVGRDGKFAIDNLPLNGGANHLTLTVADVVGNVAVTNLTVLQGDAGLTIDPVAAGQTTITGTINSTNFTVWVNGIQATLSESGNAWEAENVPTTPNGLVKVTAVPNGGGL